MKPFAVSEPDLAALAGHYTAEPPATDVTIETVGGGSLRVSLANGRAVLLRPVSPTTFRGAGRLGFYVRFEDEAGSKRLTLEAPGVPGARMKRSGR